MYVLFSGNREKILVRYMWESSPTKKHLSILTTRRATKSNFSLPESLGDIRMREKNGYFFV